MKEKLLFQLCGYELDIDFPKETEELMSQLNNCENTDVSTQRLLSSVIELRKIRWGRNNDSNGKLTYALIFCIIFNCKKQAQRKFCGKKL